jgi:lysine 2,3-aminomutase
MNDNPSDKTLTEVARRYRVTVSDYLEDRITGNESGPLAKQYRPDILELDDHPAEQSDPIGDEAHSPVPGIVHRYENRVLLKPLELCAVYCRFCFRRASVGQPDHGILSDDKLQAALDYIRDAEKVREVILTGGDPLILSPRRLQPILETLDTIDHIKILRIHTRLPVADPARITDALRNALSVTRKPIYVVLHVNHAEELTAEAGNAFSRLRRAGCILLSQSVLLKSINDSVGALAGLFQGLAELGVKPYYLHHPDLAPGTGHFRVKPEDGQALMERVRQKVSGLAMPLYVLDIPGGYGKVPIQNGQLEKTDEGLYRVRDPKGHIHLYDPGMP